jgi:5'-nucleotidase
VRFLLSNDDGVHSPGLFVLAEIASRFGEVRIVAPDREQSSMGHAITSSRPLSYRRVHLGSFQAFRVDGTPADCVSLGMNNWERVDAVLSGINLGYNVGNSTWHSGTLAAAKQGALLGVRGIALSAPPLDTIDEYLEMRPYIERVLDEILHGPPSLRLVNVNLPRTPRGMAWARQSVRHYDGRVVASTDPMGNPHFWVTAVPLESVDPDTDRAAIYSDIVAMTPLRLDLTDHAALAELRQLAGRKQAAGR